MLSTLLPDSGKLSCVAYWDLSRVAGEDTEEAGNLRDWSYSTKRQWGMHTQASLRVLISGAGAFQWEAPAPRMWEGRWIRPGEQNPSLVAWGSRFSLSRRRVSQGQVGSDNPPEGVRAPCQEVLVPVDWWRK